MYNYPKDPKRRKDWAIRTKRVNGTAQWIPSDTDKICEAHFTEAQFSPVKLNRTYRRLKWNAVPTLFPHTKPIKPRPLPTKRRLVLDDKENIEAKKSRVDFEDGRLGGKKSKVEFEDSGLGDISFGSPAPFHSTPHVPRRKQVLKLRQETVDRSSSPLSGNHIREPQVFEDVCQQKIPDAQLGQSGVQQKSAKGLARKQLDLRGRPNMLRKVYEAKPGAQRMSPTENYTSGLEDVVSSPTKDFELARERLAISPQKQTWNVVPTEEYDSPTKRPNSSTNEAQENITVSPKSQKFKVSQKDEKPHTKPSAASQPTEPKAQPTGPNIPRMDQKQTGPSNASASTKPKIVVPLSELQKFMTEKQALAKLATAKEQEIIVLKRKLKKMQFEKNKHKCSAGPKSSRKVGRHANRWENEEVRKALQLKFSCGRTGYETLLKQDYPLPSIRTLYRRTEHIKFEPGPLDEVFEMLKVKVETMSDLEKFCTVTLDEMKIKEGYLQDPSTGKCYGKVTLPGHSGDATHALVFMMGGIYSHWKQAVGYWYTPDGVDGAVFTPILTDLIKRAHNIGLHAISVTSDMGSSNQKMWK